MAFTRSSPIPVTVCVFLLTSTTLVASDADSPQPTWQYVFPSDDQTFDHAPLSPVTLSTTKPDELNEAVQYRGRQQFYAQLRFGTPDSTRVTVVVDQIDPDRFDLYVDRDRNRRIDPSERVPGEDRTRRLRLSVETIREGMIDRIPRSVLIRPNATGSTLGIATLGYLEGEADLDGRRVTVRRVDGNANGLFSDQEDQLWIDLNGDGRWDPFSEQFPYRPIVRLGAKRFAVRAPSQGGQLSFEEIVGVGHLRFTIPSLPEGATIQNLEVMLIGDDGSAYAVRGADKQVTLPIGRYAPINVTISIADGSSAGPWNFVFSRNDRPKRWYNVTTDNTVIVDPVGKLRFILVTPENTAESGQEWPITLRLYTADGLLINSSARGVLEPFAIPERYNQATIRLLTPTGEALNSTTSGFT